MIHTLLTISGEQIDFSQPVNEDKIHFDDIVWSLAHQNRFLGHLALQVSVLDHSLLVAELVRAQGTSKEVIRAALLHDATEAYLGDVHPGIKDLAPGYRELEKEFAVAIRRKFNLIPLAHIGWTLIKLADEQAREMERAFGLTGQQPGVSYVRHRLGQHPDDVRNLFLETWEDANAVHS